MRILLRSGLAVALLLSATGAFAVEGVDVSPDVVYGHKHGMALTFDVFTPKEDAKGVGILFMVSGGWHSSWWPTEQSAAYFKPLLDKGFTVFAVRHGSSPKFKIPEVVDDVRRAVRFVRHKAEKFGVDPERLGVYGGSAGGHLSLMLGTTGDDGFPEAKIEMFRKSDRVAAVVALYPPTDLRPWVGPDTKMGKDYPALQFDPEKADDCSPLLQVTEDDAPTLLIHGDKDTLVTLDHSEKILVELEKKKVPSKLIVIEGAGHGFRGEDGVRANKAMVDWFEKHLADK